MALSQAQHTLWGNNLNSHLGLVYFAKNNFECVVAIKSVITAMLFGSASGIGPDQVDASQRSLHNAPIFRLLLKVAVKGTHQCDFLNF